MEKDIIFLSKDELVQQSPQKKDLYARDIILEVLDRTPNGMSMTQIVEKTRLSRNTIYKHLGQFVAIGKVQKREFGHLSIYSKGGYVDEKTEKKIMLSDEKTFAFQIMNRGIDGNYIYIQQRELTGFRDEKITGGIMININDAKEFSKFFHTYAMGVNPSEPN